MSFFPWSKTLLKLILITSLGSQVAFAGGDDGPAPQPKPEPCRKSQITHSNPLKDFEQFSPSYNPEMANKEYHAFWEAEICPNSQEALYPVYQWVLVDVKAHCHVHTHLSPVFDCRGCQVGCLANQQVVRVNEKTYQVKVVRKENLLEVLKNIKDPQFKKLFFEGVDGENIYGAFTDSDLSRNRPTEERFSPDIFADEEVGGEWARLYKENPELFAKK